MGGEAGRWRTFGEREIYRSPYTWVGQVDVEVPGGERFWHDVIRLHRAAAMVLVEEAGEEPGEAAGREVEEEAGYRGGGVEQLIAFQPRAGGVDGELFAFVGR